jgi:hypothetical protein
MLTEANATLPAHFLARKLVSADGLPKVIAKLQAVLGGEDAE